MAKKELSRIALVSSRQESSWVSCKSITRNLFGAYSGLFPGALVRHFGLGDSAEEAWQLSDEIVSFNPERLIFVDHAPHPHFLLHALRSRYGRKKFPDLAFHVYGDFTLYAREWMSVESLLKRTSVRFICASPRQRDLVKLFCAPTIAKVHETCHFPIDTENFSFDPKIRAKWRELNGIGPNQLVLAYSGRMSLQKNIIPLTQQVYRFWKDSGKDVRFFLAGPFDFIGAPFFNIDLPQGSYYMYWKKILQAFPLKFQQCVRYLGNISAPELNCFYNGSDIFASLSLHHDEDFGMAPAEALCCGAKALLTSWGGYASFTDESGSCRLVGTKIGKHGTEFSEASCQAGLTSQTKKRSTEDERQRRSSAFQARLSIEAAANRLRSIHLEKSVFPFRGFSWIMKKQAQNHTDSPKFTDGVGKGSFYAKIYERYTEK